MSENQSYLRAEGRGAPFFDGGNAGEVSHYVNDEQIPIPVC
jgi:hypothetical protein